MAYVSFSEARLSNAQDKVLEGYRVRFKLTKEEATKLHLFFSPTRVPQRLTRDEVRIVLLLYSTRQADKLPLLKPEGQFPPSFARVVNETKLPLELRLPGRITRENFRKGIVKFLADIANK